LFEEIWGELTPGLHERTATIPLAAGRLMIKCYDSHPMGFRVFKDQVADMKLFLSHEDVHVTVANIRQKQSGDQILIRGIDYLYDSSIRSIETVTDVPVAGFEVSLEHGLDYRVSQLGEDGTVDEIENPDPVVAGAFMSICSKVLAGIVTSRPVS
jgi:hypothetical protein